MNVEIKDGHALASVGARLQGGDGDGIEVAEAHGAILRGVVPRRTQQTERGLAGLSGGQRLQGPAGRTTRVLGDVRIGGRVAIEFKGAF